LELQNLVDAGLSPYEALAAGTSHAAAFLDGADEFGRVEVGLRADLLLVADNPLTEVRNAKALVGVMLRGQWLDHGELRRKLDQLAARYESTSPADP
jgi:imidazolonepropionase-like amidohydrolase